MADLDTDLLARAVEGDRDALAALVERHAPEVRRRLAPAMPARWSAAFDLDDVMQQAFADAILAVRRFVPRGPGSFTAWLTTLGRNNLLNAIRGLEADKRGGGRPRIVAQPGGTAGDSYADLLDRLGGDSATASREVARIEARDALRRAIDELPEVSRAVVQLYDIEGCSIDAVASELGRSPGAVHMLRARAHRLLADRLGTESRYLSR